MAERLNLATYFVDRHLAEGRGEKTAVIDEDRRYTYAEIAALVNRAGNALRRAGVGPGDRVLIILQDSPEFVATYFGAMKIGAVAVPTSTALRAGDYTYLIEDSQAKVVVSEASPLDTVHESPEMECAATSVDDTAFWLWTSGSTGPPKAAVHRHADWITACEGFAHGVLGICADDTTFSSAKLFHAFGLGNGLMFPFYAGATTVLYPGKPQARAILERAHECRPTLFFSVPTHFAAMLQATDSGNPYDLSSVRLGISGRRAAARGNRAPLAWAIRLRCAGWHWFHGGAAHLYLEPAWMRAPREHGFASARLPGAHHGRKRARAPVRRNGRPMGAGR